MSSDAAFPPQVGTPSPEPRPAAPVAPAPKVTLQSMPEWYGSRLIGMNVKNPQGQELGEVEELVLDPQDGKIKNVVISSGGVLGIGAKRVALPWDQVNPATDEQTFIVGMTKRVPHRRLVFWSDQRTALHERLTCPR